MVPQARIIALDVGERRIGIAVSDPLGITAQGLPTIERSNRLADLAKLTELAKEYQPKMWLIGLPLHLSGREGKQAEKVRQWGTILEKASGIRVQYWDERLTTVEAARVLREADVSLSKHRQAIDRLSAVIILQSYLDSTEREIDAGE